MPINVTDPSNLAAAPRAIRTAKGGVWKGQQVTQKISIASAIQNALEELTELGAERSADEEVKKDEFHDKDKASSRLKTEVEEIEKLISKMDDTDTAAEVEKFVAAKTQFRNYDPSQLLREAERRFKDPSWRFVALAALEHGTADPAPNEPQGLSQLRTTAAAAKQTLLAADGPRILGGINITPQASKLASTSSEMSELRDFYADNTLGYGGVLHSYDKIIEQFGEGGVERGAKFLIAAAGDDLGSITSSMPKERLKTVLDELYSLEVIATMHEGAGAVLGRLESISPGSMTKISPSWLMRAVLTLAKKDWVDAAEVMENIKIMGGSTPFTRINVLREMRRMVVRLPLKVTAAQPQSRERLITAVQEALDETATLEDEEQEEQGGET